MKRLTPYLKMRVLGAIETAPGSSRIARIRHVATLPFVDEYGYTHFFTWRTIQTWWSRYQKNGITEMNSKPRSDRGTFRKVSPEAVLEAVQSVLPSFHQKSFKVSTIYLRSSRNLKVRIARRLRRIVPLSNLTSVTISKDRLCSVPLLDLAIAFLRKGLVSSMQLSVLAKLVVFFWLLSQIRP